MYIILFVLFLYILNKNPLDSHSHKYTIYSLSIIVCKKEIKKEINAYVPKQFGSYTVL